MSIVVQSYMPRQLIIDGNSLSTRSDNTIYLKRWANTLYSLVRTNFPQSKWSIQNYAFAGADTQDRIDNFPNVSFNYGFRDIAFYFEGVNDSNTLLSGQAIYDKWAEYAALVKATGCKLVMITPPAMNVSARNGYITAANAILRNNPQICDLIIDIAAKPEFDSIGDTSSDDYYDGVHLTNDGYDKLAAYVYNDLVSNNFL